MDQANTSDKKAALDQWLKRKREKVVQNDIISKPKDKAAVLSHGQERLWLMDQLYPESHIYNHAHQYSIKGGVKIDLLANAIQRIANRHRIILTNYESVDGKLIQVQKHQQLTIEQFDLSNLSESERNLEIHTRQQALIHLPFDLSIDQLLRVYVFKFSGQEYKVLLVMHHILGDAWSVEVVNQELTQIYSALNQGHEPLLESLKYQYSDFAYWQRTQGIKASDLAFWKQNLSGDLPILSLPKESSNTANSFEGRAYRKPLSAPLTTKLKELAKEMNTTMYVLLLTAYKVLLLKYTRQTDIIVGSPFSNRDTKDLEKLIGFFNETLALRTKIDDQLSFSQLVNQIKESTLNALSHKNVPFDTLVNEISAERQAGENPVFQTMFLYNNPQHKLFLGKEIHVEEEMLHLNISKFDLTLFVNEVPNNLELVFEHSVEISDGLIVNMADHFEVLLEQIVAGSTHKISSLSIFSEYMLTKLSEKWNGKELALEPVQSIHELIQKRVNENPEAKAVSYGAGHLTYSELDRWSNHIAHQLQMAGVEKNQFVGLFTQRSLEMVVGILGILKAGGAYLPLDPDYPEERINFMLADASVKIILTQPEITNDLTSSSTQTIEIVDAENYEISDISELEDHLDDFAYVIYTSGSTGKPKGVPVSHRNLIHSTTARFDFFEDRMESFLLLSSFSFDSSVAGIFWSLCSGGTLVLPPKRIEQDLDGLTTIIRENNISHTLMLPSLYQVLLNYSPAENLTSLKTIMVAGEASSIALRKAHFEKLPQARLYNEYGPTEASVWCIAHEITPSDKQVTVPIGKPISNTQAYVLNDSLQPVPIGVAGELYIGGKGVTNGYLNRPELTEERFLTNPFEDNNEKIYRTGDLAKFNGNGIIEFLGRADQQIKIRGYRVELEEIRNLILEMENIEDAVVDTIADTNGNKKIVAWLQSSISGIEKSLVQALKSSIPDYMVPGNFIVMEALPKLPNGKVNRSALPSSMDSEPGHSDYIPAKTDKQKMLVDIWQNILGVPQIGIQDNFFDIGGDSILSIQIVAQARHKNLKIGPTQIFEFQTIEELSANIHFTSSASEKAVENQEEYPLKLPLSYQQQAFLFHSLQEEHDQGFLQLEFQIKGEVDIELMQTAWRKVVKLHPVMRTSFDWSDFEEPYQTIHTEANLPWSFLDLSNQPKDQQESSIENYKQEDKVKGLNLKEAGCSRLTLVQSSTSEFLLIWTCHHVLVDGWSGAIILKDALKIYDSLKEEKEAAIQPVSNYSNYFNWKSHQNENEAKKFWVEMLKGFDSPLLSDYSESIPKTQTDYQDITVFLKPETVSSLKEIASKERLTINTLMQGLWMITLSNYFNQNDITIGLTLSGRSSDFEGIDRITGLFMNVLPFRKEVQQDTSLISWLNEIQTIQSRLRAYEHTDANKVQSWVGNSDTKQLFDSLFVFGNFMKDSLTIGDITVDNFKGGFSSTFPLTTRVNPSSIFEINCRYNSEILSTHNARWIIDAYCKIINKLVQEDVQNLLIQDLKQEGPQLSKDKPATKLGEPQLSKVFTDTENQTQLELSKIWSTLLGIERVDIHDNYFELGGTSIIALQLFSQIEKAFGKKLSPTALLKNPTIAKLAVLISGEVEEKWSSIIPMKSSGDKAPLFCIHSGGAHVLFYQSLAKYMVEDRPVYAIQPTGIDGNEAHHESISIMASHYINEMQRVQPQGPYHLIGTCFGNAVGVEMAHQLRAINQGISVFYVVDSAPAYLQPPSPNGERKPISRMLNMIKSGNWNGIVKKFRNRYIRLDKKLSANQRDQQQVELDEMISSLNDLYTSYTWKPIDEKVVLIRSSEFSERKDKEFHLKQWVKLAKKGVEVCEVKGHHLTLFEEPEVQGLAKALNEHISRLS